MVIKGRQGKNKRTNRTKRTKRTMIGATLLVGSAALAVAFIGCGKKSSDDEDTTTASNPVSSNPAATAYPTSLAISAFPTTSTSLADTDPENMSPDAKKSEQEKLLKGEGSSCVPKIMDQSDKDATTETCYEFDQDMIYGTNQSGKTFGTRDGKNSSGEACLVAFARAQVKRIVGQVDRSLGMAQMALCQRKKDGETALPAVDQEIDLAPFLKKVMPKGTVTAAKLKRLSDASDGAKVFKMSFDVSRPDGIPMVISIVHSPKSDDNTSYTGYMATQVVESDATKKLAETGKTRVISVLYDRSSDKMKYTLRSANVATALVAKAFGTDGQVDYNLGDTTTFTGTAASSNMSYGAYTGYAQANDAISAMTTVSFEGNPTTNEGTFGYWQNPGGNYYERARGMLASMTYDATAKTLSGCAVSGAAGTSTDGISIRRSVKETKTMEPAGAYHPFFNTQQSGGTCGTPSTTASSDTTGSYYFCPSQTTTKWYVPKDLSTNGTTFVTEQQPALFTRQCFKQNTSGVYEIDATKTTPSAGFELIATTDTAKKISPPAAPEPGKGVKKQ
jgi:hypothetical protein